MPPIVRIEKYADRDLAKAELRPLLTGLLQLAAFCFRTIKS